MGELSDEADKSVAGEVEDGSLHHSRLKRLGTSVYSKVGEPAWRGFGMVSVKSLQRLGEGRFSSEEVALEQYYEKYLSTGW